jgi:GAF domain-containing protein/HAMP domain-containing protein
MTERPNPPNAHRGRLFRKYLALILSLVTTVLLVSSGINLYSSYQENKAALASLQHEKAIAAASRIEQYVRQISQQLAYAALLQLDAGDTEMRRVEFGKLLRQAPEITDVAWLDAEGKERNAVSRLGMDVTGSGRDRSAEPAFISAKRGQPWYGPVYFRKETEPYMTVAIRSGGDKGPVTVADVNLKFIWDVVSRIKIGDKGKAYVVDAAGQLVADPDIGLVLRKTSLAGLAHVKAAASAGRADEPAMVAKDLNGTTVLASAAPIAALDWRVFVEQPVAEVYAKLDASILRTVLLLLAGLVISALAASALARSMVRPIRTLDDGARRIGEGELDQQIVIKTGDELEGLADQFNRMTGQLRESYAGLERKVEQRTTELTETLEYQTAISEVLRVISSSTTDVTPVFDAIMDSAVRLFDAPIAAVFRYDGRDVHLVGTRGWSAESLEDSRRLYPAPPNPQMLSGRLILAGQALSEEDVRTDPDYDLSTAQVGQWRRMIGAPMLKEGVTLGAIVVAWPDPGTTPQRQTDLLKTFADQAVIAIENVRLISETKEALEQQTATAEVLQVISGSMADARPVFEKILRSCQRLFASEELGTLLVGDDGQLRLGASLGPTGERRERDFVRPVVGSATELAIRARRVLHYPDVNADTDMPATLREFCLRMGLRSLLMAPMLWEDRGVGSIWVARTQPRPYTDKNIALLKTFADQAVIAIQNARLFNETKETLEQQTATAEILKVISGSPTNVQPVLEAVAERSGSLCRAEGSRVWLLNGEQLLAMTSYGPGYGSDAVPERLPLQRSSVAGRAFLERTCVHVDDVVPLIDTEYPDVRELQAHHRFRTVLAVPMLREGKSVGVISLLRNEVRPFTPTEINLIQTFADQAVIAIENVRLFSETREALERQTATAEILQVIGSSVADTAPVFEKILLSCRHLFDSAEQGVLLIGEDGKMRLGAHHGTTQARIEAHFAEPQAATEFERSIRERRLLYFPDVLGGEGVPIGVRDAARQMGMGTYSQAFAPMVWEERAVGSLYVTRNSSVGFSDKVLDLL